MAQFNCINLPTEAVETDKIPQNMITEATNEEV